MATNTSSQTVAAPAPSNAVTGLNAELAQTVNAAVRQALAEYGLHRGTPAPAEPPAALNSAISPVPEGFLDLAGLMARLPLSERTIRSEIQKGRLPHVRLPGSRRLLFFWPTVQASLLRFQEGGIQ